jgi:uncharacterized C2H2 Zn-finger protein
MRNFFSRLMYGRYGSDALSLFLFVFGLLFYLIGVIVPVKAVYVLFTALGYGAMVCTILRMWSKNYAARRAENDKFMELITPLVQGIQRKRAPMRDKDHAYFRCPSCGQVLRVPKGKNRISITCRNCGNVFQKKT